MESPNGINERSSLLKKRNNSHISIAINSQGPSFSGTDRSPSDFNYIHTFSIEEVFRSTGSRNGGLTNTEVMERISKYGLNTIKRKAGKSLILKFLSNFTHLMAILLWCAAIIGFIAETPQLGVAICLVNVINGMFSFWQEFKAEKATEALRNLLPTYMNVIRENGERTKIVAEQLVVGDVILLEEGDRISADAVVVDASDLYIDQSTLTGESVPVNKQTRDELLSNVSSLEKLQTLRRLEAQNITFAGTSVVSGTGKAVVYATGMNSELGKIAHLTQTFAESLSPLQKEMQKITKTVTAMAVSVGAMLFLLAYLLANVGLAESFIFAMGMAVALVPEGMLPLVTLTLAMGTQRMAKRNALIKKLSSVETLGCTSVICSDKTGTLTQNQMTACNIWMPNGQQFTVSGSGYAPQGEFIDSASQKPVEKPLDVVDMPELLLAAGLCNNATIVPPTGQNNRWGLLGDPTEGALKVLGIKAGLNYEAESQQCPRIKEFPFDSKRKRMSTIHNSFKASTQTLGLDYHLVYTKGAPKELLELCTHYRVHGEEIVFTEDMRSLALRVNDAYADGGLRVLAVAQRFISADMQLMSKSVETKLCFLGLIAMEDPPRPEVYDAVARCHTAGIRVVMVTGDYERTAISIANQIGITRNPRPRVITGTELESLDDETLKNLLHDEVIFARVSPEHKLRVVDAFQQLGNIVACTADGTNDAPALKKADIGVAMGLSGTEVAKEAADMILLDDNFASIVHAVEEGRAVFSNIKKFIIYIFTSNSAEALPFILFIFTKGRIPLALTVMQVLFVDLGTDMVPALALGAEPPEPGIMERPPRNLNDHIITPSLIFRSLFFLGLIQAGAAMSGFYFEYWINGYWETILPLPDTGIIYESATAMALSAVVFSQIGNLFATRTEIVSFFEAPVFNNKLIWFGIAFELGLLFLILNVPFLQGVFETHQFHHWGNFVFLIGCIPLLLLSEEVRKLIARKISKNSFSVYSGKAKL